MNTRSIRFRLTAWYALVLTAGLSLFGVLVWVSLSHQLSAEIDAELAGRASRLETYFKEEIAQETGDHLRVELVEFSRAFGPDSSVAITSTQGFEFRYPARPTASGRILHRNFAISGRYYDLSVEVPTNEMTRTLAVLRGLLISLIPVVVLIASVGGAILSGRALRPVNALTEAANSISIENLSERLPEADTGDEIARLAATLNTMLTRLEGAVATLSQFVADASHEFRTPLAVLQTTVELALRRPRSSDEYRLALEEIAVEVTRMTQLVGDLLALARTDTGAVDMPRSATDVVSVLTRVLNETRPLAALRQLRIIPPPETPVWITGNQPALHRLFLVLIDNALKYSKPDGEVLIGVEHNDEAVLVSIKDFGSGIAPGHLPHIFKRFYRGDPARTAGGHGLGLALAQSIAQSHGAQITVASIEGVSTECRVEFAARAMPRGEKAHDFGFSKAAIDV